MKYLGMFILSAFISLIVFVNSANDGAQVLSAAALYCSVIAFGLQVAWLVLQNVLKTIVRIVRHGN